jgi:hypothetical protein
MVLLISPQLLIIRTRLRRLTSQISHYKHEPKHLWKFGVKLVKQVKSYSCETVTNFRIALNVNGSLKFPISPKKKSSLRRYVRTAYHNVSRDFTFLIFLLRYIF